MFSGLVRRLKPLEEQPHGAFAQRGHRSFDGGQADVVRAVNAVKPDNRDLLRNLHSVRPEILQNGQGHGVVQGEEGARQPVLRPILPKSFNGVLGVIVSVNVPTGDAGPLLLQRLLATLEPQLRILRAGRPAHNQQVLVPQVQQMRHGGMRATAVLHVDGTDVAVVRVALDQHDRLAVRLQVIQQRLVEGRIEDDHAVDPHLIEHACAGLARLGLKMGEGA